MKWNRIHEYAILERIEHNGHRHYATNGRPVPSVTTILNAISDKPGLVAWRKRVGEAEANRIVKESTDVGTLMHEHLELYVLGKDRPPGRNHIHNQARSMADVIIEKGLSNVDEVWGVEVGLINPDLYAGTTDCVGVWKGNPAIIDFKNTRKPKKAEWVEDYYLQTVMYGEAHNAMHGTTINTGVIMMCSWNNMYQEFIVTPDRWKHYVEKMYEVLTQYYTKILEGT